MFAALRRKWREGREAWRGLRAFEALAAGARRIVFYAESAADWAHLMPVVRALELEGERVIRLTSDRNDSVLDAADAFFIGQGSARTVLFRTIEADAFFMTLPDLEQFHLKRSAHPVHYVYVFHSIASTHRVYREHAFDAYDTIFCVGPHHIDEIRRTEEVYGLAPKRLVEHGYGRLDTLMSDLAARPPAASSSRIRVLIAPSWGECSMVQHGLDETIAMLLASDFDVSVRLHPMTVRHHPELPGTLIRTHGDSGRFHYDPDVSTTAALLAADVMISEWSGAALEYAFARERPVIFIDTPAKIHNPNHVKVALPALEAEIRGQIGRVISPLAVGELPQAVRDLVAEAETWSMRIRAIRERTVFNVGRSGKAGARHILDTLSRGRARG